MKCRLKLAVYCCWACFTHLSCLVIILTHITSQQHNLNWIHDEPRWDEHSRTKDERTGKKLKRKRIIFNFLSLSRRFSSHSSEIEWISFTVMMLQRRSSSKRGKWKQFSSFIPSSWAGGSAERCRWLFSIYLVWSPTHFSPVTLTCITYTYSCEEHALFWILSTQHSSSGRNNNTQEWGEKLRMTNVTLSEFCSPFTNSKHVHEVFLLHNFS